MMIFYNIRLPTPTGKAVRQTADGDVEERAYAGGRLEGQATVIYPDSSKEIRNYTVKSAYN